MTAPDHSQPNTYMHGQPSFQAPDPRLGEIAADFLGFEVIASGLSDVYVSGSTSPAVVAAFAKHALYLLAAVADRDAKLARVEALCENRDGWGLVSTRGIRAAVVDTTGGEEK